MAKENDFNYNFVTPHTIVVQKNYGWKLEVNKISWNGNKPKYDIRSWNNSHEKMSKGLSFTKEELLALRDTLNSMELE